MTVFTGLTELEMDVILAGKISVCDISLMADYSVC